MAHHEPFKALAPIDWTDVPQDCLSSFLSSSFSSALTIIESIPVSPATAKQPPVPHQPRPTPVVRSRSHTDPPRPTPSDVTFSSPSPESQAKQRVHHVADSLAHAQALRKEWKEVKVNPKDNPLGISAYKLAAKDGKGSWFARRSVHEGVGFERWRLGLEREFAETMKVKGGAGSGSIRGIGAERRVEEDEVEGSGKLELFQLSAQFPGPTTPRDFVTLVLTSESETGYTVDNRPLRSFIVVSKPCIHSECPPRNGFIRGQYESVEIIREIPSPEPAVKRSRSSIDLGARERAADLDKDLSKSAFLQESRSPTLDGRKRSATTTGDASLLDDDSETSTVIEWLMVTRSDPGGSVPRFMIEKGTPGGIVADAGKFIKWMKEKSIEEFANTEDVEQDDALQEAKEAEDNTTLQNGKFQESVMADSAHEQGADNQEDVPSSNGLYSVLASAIGAAASVAARLPNPFTSTSGTSTPTIPEVDEDDSSTLASPSSSVHSFASAFDTQPDDATSTTATFTSSTKDDHDLSDLALPPGVPANTPAEKELQKIEARRSKFQERIAKMQVRMSSRQSSDRQRDEQAIARAREKHERDMAKQEEKYRRELRKLEERRANDEKRAEERRRKAAEREEKETLRLELERAKEERDLAMKEVEALKGQVGALQKENTMLVAKYGRLEQEDGKGGGKRTNGSISARGGVGSRASSMHS